MKTSLKNDKRKALFLALWLTTIVASAQTYTNLYTLSPSRNNGGTPLGALLASGSTLYGTTGNGGTNGGGMVFRMNTDGTGFTHLYDFTAPVSGTNSDGFDPVAGLVLSGDVLYGTASYGGASGNGTVFRVNTDGTDFTNLHSFTARFAAPNEGVYGTNNDGSNPEAGLLLSGNILYGTTYVGGWHGNGSVFRVDTDGTDFANLHSFNPHNSTEGFPTERQGRLVLSGNTLFGMTQAGGTNRGGTIYSLSTNGTGFTTLFMFGANARSYSANGLSTFTNATGFSPARNLTLSGDRLYGTTWEGGTNGVGTVFAINTDGTGFTILHTFATAAAPGSDTTNADGALPVCDLLISGGTLYGTTTEGGPVFGRGTVFAVNTDGTGFTNLYFYNGFNIFGEDGVVLSSNDLYGKTEVNGGIGGTIFALSLPTAVAVPRLAISRAGANVILTWPVSATGFLLQTNGDLTTANWSNYIGTMSTNGTLESAFVKPSAGNLFFRLAKP